MKTVTLSILTIGLITTMSGCGGGSSGNTTPVQPTKPISPTQPIQPTTPIKPTQPTQPTQPTTPTKPNEPTTQIGTYRLDKVPSTQSNYIQQINHLATQGYVLVNPTTQGLLSYKPNHTINIEYLSDDKKPTLNILNDMGKQGYLYKMPTYDNAYKFFNLYIKNKASKKTYQYQSFKANESFLTKTNELGKNGWRYHSMLMLDNNQHYLYMKETGNTNYEYRVETDYSNLAKFREQINQQAKEGFVYRGGLALNTTKLVNLFERTTNQKSISCEVVEMPTNIDLTLMNQYAKQGHISLGKLIIGTQSVEVFCKGIDNVWQPLTGAMLP